MVLLLLLVVVVVLLLLLLLMILVLILFVCLQAIDAVLFEDSQKFSAKNGEVHT